MNRIVLNAKARITTPFGPNHKNGVDIGWIGGDGDNIYAHSDGVVTTVVTGRKKNNNTSGMDTYGNYVDIKHDDGFLTRYAHLSQVDVKKGDRVVVGQKIGYMGESGNTYGKHLHFEVRRPDGYSTNPTPYLDGDFPDMPNGSMKKVEPVVPEKPGDDYEKVAFKVGDKVVPIKLIDYNGTSLVKYDEYYTITELVYDRAVLSARGQVWCAMNTNNIELFENQ